MRARLVAFALAAGALSLLSQAPALADGTNSKNHFEARLRGANEVPAISSPGRAKAELWIDDKGEAISFELSYRDLEGAITAGHVHFAQPGVNGGVIFFLCGGGGKPPCPAAPATVKGEVGPADILGPAEQGIEAGEFDEAVAAIRAGLTYVNLHTDRFTAGEIRGQLR